MLDAVIRPQVRASPAALSASAPPLDIGERNAVIKRIDGDSALVVTRPISVALATAIHKQLANAVGAD